MKRIVLIAGILLAAIPMYAQRLVIGERAPELKVDRWITAAPTNAGKAVMVEFYHSSNPANIERLTRLDQLARANGDKLNVIVITREGDPAVIARLSEGTPSYYAGYDRAGASFTSFGARYVPYAVIYDKRGRILWVGNPSTLSNDDIESLIK